MTLVVPPIERLVIPDIGIDVVPWISDLNEIEESVMVRVLHPVFDWRKIGAKRVGSTVFTKDVVTWTNKTAVFSQIELKVCGQHLFADIGGTKEVAHGTVTVAWNGTLAYL